MNMQQVKNRIKSFKVGDKINAYAFPNRSVIGEIVELGLGHLRGEALIRTSSGREEWVLLILARKE